MPDPEWTDSDICRAAYQKMRLGMSMPELAEAIGVSVERLKLALGDTTNIFAVQNGGPFWTDL